MSRFLNERIKTICIVILIVAGILQVGILWGYQSQGTPISFLSGIFKREKFVSDAVARERLFVPERLILSSGTLSHWVIGRNSDFYDMFWSEAKQGLEGIASGNVILRPSTEEWGDVVEKRGLIVELGYLMKPELLKWFLSTGEKGQELPDVLKLMIKPDIINENMSVFYIYSAGGRVYSSEPISFEKRAYTFEDVITTIENNKAQEYRNYYTFRGNKIDKVMGAEADVLFVFLPPGHWPYFEYKSRPPEKGERKEELAENILGNEKDRYNKSQDNEGTFQFNYGSNIYRYYAEGYLTYRYLGGIDTSGKGEVGEALLNAYKFVDRINNLSETDADIMLTSVLEKQQGVFSFSFDYRLKGMPVKLKLNMKDGKEMTHAINIQADKKRVLTCEGFLRDFVQGKKNHYSDRFLDMDLRRLTGKTYDEMNIRDMRTGYFMDSVYDTVLKPKLLIDMKDQNTFELELMPEKGG